MDSSLDLDSNSFKISMNPDEQSGLDASPDSHTDPAEDNSSEEYTDSDDDPNPGLAGGGCYVIDLEKGSPDIVEKAQEGIQAAIDDFNQRHGTTYKLVEIQEVLRTICHGYAFTLSFTAKPADSLDNLLTEFEAYVGTVPPDYKMKSVRCEAKSSKRAIEPAIDDYSCSKRQRGMRGSPQPLSDSEKL